MIVALLALAAAALPEPSDATVIYYNARMALREGRPAEATRLWLLRNAVAEHAGVLSPHDADFHSVTWAALGDLGVCQDGFPTDEDGAGLWPVALHNWVVRNRTRTSWPKRPKPFAAFEVGRQQRFIGLDDVLGVDELTTTKFTRGRCSRPRWLMVKSGEKIRAKLSDRQVAARLLTNLLQQARSTLAVDRVRGRSAIDARLFDLYLARAELAAQEARREASDQARRGRDAGLSRESVAALREDARKYTFLENSEPARILRESVHWPASEWMALSADRRVFLFDHARAYGGDAEVLDRTALEILDRLTARGEGAEVARWIPRRSAQGADPEVWSGERGQRLMALGPETGFDERGVIALHQGVARLEGGDLPGALRAMAYALQNAQDSASAEVLHGLSLRWMSYVASQFEITDTLLVTLQELVPRREYGVLLEDLMWGAALRADKASFERGNARRVGRGALSRRLDLLEPLSAGDIARFTTRVKEGLKASPSETLRFLDAMIQRLELEDAGVRAAHLPTLARLHALVEPLADPDREGGQNRSALALLERMQAIVEGLGGLGPDASDRDRARSLDPGGAVFAGAVRLAPSDPLPWPFRVQEVPPPSIFEVMQLLPEEWPDPGMPVLPGAEPVPTDDFRRSPDGAGEWVFGWSIRG